MSEYKYEPVFGSQALFCLGPEDAVSVRYGKSEYIFDSGEIKATTGQLRDVPIVAMRRIIPEPKRWTWEDKKAGRLPEVDCIVTTYDGKPYVFVGESCHENQWSLRDAESGKVYHTPITWVLPLETPEEKAARLREEWCIKALRYNSQSGSKVEAIYDALLSGDLPVPGKE